MKLKVKSSKLKIFLLVTSYSLLVAILGCDAFVRKFTRKPKRENLPKEEMVLVPEEYKGHQIPKEELYRRYFLFWKTWHDELINSLSIGASHKKQIDCMDETINNLTNLRAFLNENKQKKLDIYINQLKELKDSIVKDIYSTSSASNRLTAERIKRNVLQDFAYRKIKDYLI